MQLQQLQAELTSARDSVASKGAQLLELQVRRRGCPRAADAGLTPPQVMMQKAEALLAER